METHWASFFKRSINIYINSLYVLKAKSLKFSIDILNHKNIFLLYYINLNAILNHKNKLLLFFLRKKSSNTIFYFHMLFIYLFLSLPFCLFLLWNSLVSLPLHLIISLPMKARHYQEKKKKKFKWSPQTTIPTIHHHLKPTTHHHHHHQDPQTRTPNSSQNQNKSTTHNHNS